MKIEREVIGFDILIVGAGPAGLAAAIRLMQLGQKTGKNLSVAILEKGDPVGAHAISGAVLNPAALSELLPGYEKMNFPQESRVEKEGLYFLTPQHACPLPFLPRYMKSKGFPVISLSRFTSWLGGLAQELGVDIFSGFAGQKVLFAHDGKTVSGVRTSDLGLDADGSPLENFEPGVDIHAKVTVFAEGARGSLTRQLQETLFPGNLCQQKYETGIRETIRLPDPGFEKKGTIIHTLGHPLGLCLDTPGGGFLYPMSKNHIALGFLVGLSYPDPGFDIYENFIRFKRHPFIREMISGGKVVEQGARTVSTGGYDTVSNIVANRALVIGGGAGFQNTPALKGIHLSMKSGILAAETIMDAFDKDDFSETGLDSYHTRIRKSWIHRELHEVRRFYHILSQKGACKLLPLAFDYFFRGKLPLPLPGTKPDHTTFQPAKKPGQKTGEKSFFDDSLYVDKMKGVFLSKTTHRENQPSHLKILAPDICIEKCIPKYNAPCTRFCPAGVYELVVTETDTRIRMNPANCLHCKTCDIKDPFSNILWVCPEGGDGPGYTFS